MFIVKNLVNLKDCVWRYEIFRIFVVKGSVFILFIKSWSSFWVYILCLVLLIIGIFFFGFFLLGYYIVIFFCTVFLGDF